jgi:hypothetical protein
LFYIVFLGELLLGLHLPPFFVSSVHALQALEDVANLAVIELEPLGLIRSLEDRARLGRPRRRREEELEEVAIEEASGLGVRIAATARVRRRAVSTTEVSCRPANAFRDAAATDLGCLAPPGPAKTCARLRWSPVSWSASRVSAMRESTPMRPLEPKKSCCGTIAPCAGPSAPAVRGVR